MTQAVEDRSVLVEPIWLVRLAAWQPLVLAPGSGYHHSNIGWNIARLIAGRVAGIPLPALYEERIFAPLELRTRVTNPRAPITGPHAEGYLIGTDGSLTEATAWTAGKGADGAIVTNAADEARFLQALVNDELHVRQRLLDFYGASGTNTSDCPGNAFVGHGAGAAGRSYVHYDQTGTHVAVLLLNGFREGTGATGDAVAQSAAVELYCGA